MSDVLPRSVVRTYAIGSIGTGGFNTLPGLVLLFYLTDVVGVAAGLAGIVVAAAKIWDVIIDPVIGSRSDHSLATTGSRQRFMRLGALLIGVFFLLTFASPFVGWAAAAWVVVFFMASALAFSLFQVPYLALASEVTTSYDQRTRLLTWRMVALTAAILVFGGVAPALRGLFDSERLGYLVMALFSAVLIGAAMWVASFAAPHTSHVVTPGDEGQHSLRDFYRDGLAAVRSSQPFRALLVSFILKSVALGMMLAVGQYVATWVLGREAAVTWIFLALVGPALVVTPLWGRAAVRWGKEPLVYVSGGLFAAGALALLALLWWPGPWLYAAVAVCGVAYAGMQSMPLSILPDVVAWSAAKGRFAAGVFIGVWTAGETAGLAVGALLLSLMLSATGYVSSAAETVTQPEGAIDAIVLGISAVPAVLVLVSLVVFRGYRLRRVDIEATA